MRETLALLRSVGLEKPILRAGVLSAGVVLVLFLAAAIVHPEFEFPLLLSLVVCVAFPLVWVLVWYGEAIAGFQAEYVVSARGVGLRSRPVRWRAVRGWDVQESPDGGVDLCLAASNHRNRIPLPEGEKREIIIAVVASHAPRDSDAGERPGPVPSYSDSFLVWSVGAGVLLGLIMPQAIVRFDPEPVFLLLALIVAGPGSLAVLLAPGFRQEPAAARWIAALLLNLVCLSVAFPVFFLVAAEQLGR